MGNNNLSENENILIKVDQNNLMYIDPNSVMDNEGNILPRNVKQEELMMYVNLEADLVPRSILVAENDSNTLTAIAKGTFNMLKNANGEYYDTTWTDSFINKQTVNDDGKAGTIYTDNDTSAQTFGIQSINIQVKGMNYIPQVDMTFVDVRGKTLFESPENSPYNAFFHLPWPIYYLTVKGFYGKAIKYRLHLVKFNTRFNDNTGNFDITTKFIGSTYAFLTDIPLKGVLNAPYMFPIETTKELTFNSKTNQYDQRVSKSSRGYTLLKTIYSEYKQKGLIPQDFPVKTLREVIVVAKSLDKILEREILDQVVNTKVIAGLKDYEEKLTNFEDQVKSWATKNLSTDFVINSDTKEYGYYLGGVNNDKTSLVNITGSTKMDSLEFIVRTYNEKLKESQIFVNSILKGKGNPNFLKISSKTTSPVDKYFYVLTGTKQPIIEINKLVNDILDIRKDFNEQNNKFQDYIEKKINEIVRDPAKGIGFDPTIRNIFAVLLANAEVFVRMMQETHRKAFEVSNKRKDIIKNFGGETIGEAIYPWPEIKKPYGENKQKVIAYPGEPDLEAKLQSNNPILWPEIDFIENYKAIATQKTDPLGEKEGGVNNINYVFESDSQEKNIKKIGTLSYLIKTLPYGEDIPSTVFYEIWERILYHSYFDTFNDESYTELSKIESDNIKNSFIEDESMLTFLREKINTEYDLRNLLKSSSPYQKYPYYQDSLPTTPYLIDVLSTPFAIEGNIDMTGSTSNDLDYSKTNEYLKNYTPENYRKNIYPFNSDLYLSYQNSSLKNYEDNTLKFRGNLQINTKESFIVSPINSKSWVKSNYTQNIFDQKLKIGSDEVNILNTPYFHKQLISDYGKNGGLGKYVGSAYLLLNSLPFYDLEDKINLDDNLDSFVMSDLFREVGSTHYIPYHLIVKWGSIYHRYKTYILDGVDILDGFLTTGNTTTVIDGQTFFNNNQTGSTYTSFTLNNLGSGYTTTYSGNPKDVGVHPYYDAIYHQIVNGYTPYNIDNGNTSYSGNVNNGNIQTRMRTVGTNGINYWTTFVDNSKYDTNDLRYTVLPSDGGNDINKKRIISLNGIIPTTNTENFYQAEQSNLRLIWSDEIVGQTTDFSGKTYPSYSEYNRTFNTGSTRSYDNLYGFDTTYRKVIDLISTFSPDILNEFENIFLNFASEKIITEVSYNRFSLVKHTNFQDLLSSICSVTKESEDSSLSLNDLINKLKNRQINKLYDITSTISSYNNLLKLTIANPKEINLYVFQGFAKTATGNTFTYNGFNPSQLTTQNRDYIKLYIGEDIDLYYENFFAQNNVELSLDNILNFRPLVLIYGGFKKQGNNGSFVDYIKSNIIVSGSNRFSKLLTKVIQTFRNTDFKASNDRTNIKIQGGYNQRELNIELYNYFKAINDKWIAGNSIGQRLLMDEFLFLDKANRDIGDRLYLDLDRLVDVVDEKNINQNLYGAISMMIQGTGLDMRPLPSYVNFYGTNFSHTAKLTPSKNVAKNIFGTFLEVDYQESSPKIVIQLVGLNSKHPDIVNKKYKFNDDSFDLSNVNNNPLIITTNQAFTLNDLSKSNKVVAFEVSFGDQNQSIFKGVQLDQSTIKETSASMYALEQLGRSESGAGAYNVDIGLFDYYRQASYSCEVTCMGNVMIQPTMFFYLKNIPMFKGSYWITEVSHDIKPGTITTKFTGSRIPSSSLPDPKDSFTSSYKSFFERITKAATAKIDFESKNTPVNVISVGKYQTDPGNLVAGENKDSFYQDGGYTEIGGIAYNGINGDQTIQMVKYNGDLWLRARVVKMGDEKEYPITDNTTMSLINKLNPKTHTIKPSTLPWSEIKTSNSYFYSTKFDINVNANKLMDNTKTKFFNPTNKLVLIMNSTYQLDSSIGIRQVIGPVSIMPVVKNYGIAMSEEAMRTLKLNPGDVIYFRIDNK